MGLVRQLLERQKGDAGIRPSDCILKVVRSSQKDALADS